MSPKVAGVVEKLQICAHADVVHLDGDRTRELSFDAGEERIAFKMLEVAAAIFELAGEAGKEEAKKALTWPIATPVAK